MNARLVVDDDGTRRVEVDTGTEGPESITPDAALRLAIELIDAVAEGRAANGSGCERGHYDGCRHQGEVWTPS